MGSQSGVDLRSTSSKNFENYDILMERLRRTLYYGHKPPRDHPSFPVTDILVTKFREYCQKDSLDELNLYEASFITYNACITPCSIILALIYLERLRVKNPEYLTSTSSSQTFLVSLMIASKFLNDDGEDEEVYNDEWASSAAILLSDLNEAEIKFLSAIEWNLFVDFDSFFDVLTRLEAAVAKKQSSLHGFFVYSDLVSLSDTYSGKWLSLSHLIGSTFLTCIVYYAGAVLIAVSSAFTAHKCLSLLSISSSVSRPMSQLSQCGENASIEHFVASLHASIDEDNLEEMVDVMECPMENDAGDILIDSSLNRRKSVALRTLTTAMLLASSSFADNSSWDYFNNYRTDPSAYFDSPSNSVPLRVPLWPVLDDCDLMGDFGKKSIKAPSYTYLRNGRKRRKRPLHLTGKYSDYSDSVDNYENSCDEILTDARLTTTYDKDSCCFENPSNIWDSIMNFIDGISVKDFGQFNFKDEHFPYNVTGQLGFSTFSSNSPYTFGDPHITCSKSVIFSHALTNLRETSHLMCQT